ncbi:MAG: DUF3880 domain-containing protein, partial [Deltaproteobacteria bacterium]|nr:DUF3880 domain-containing protein [Deltaproteobacteria bacterium]
MDLFERNLKILNRIDGSLARRMERTRALPSAEVLEAKNGSLTLKVDGAALHSTYDPVREAMVSVERFLEKEPGPGPIFVLGLGFGYHVERLHRAAPSSPLILVEPSPGIFRLALEKIEMEGILAPCRRVFVGEAVDEVFARINEKSLLRGGYRVFVHPPSLKMSRAYLDRLLAGLEAREILAGLRLNILVVPPVYGGSLPVADYCVRALRRMGHTVTTVDNSKYLGLFKEIEGVTTNRFHQRQLQGSLTQHLSEIVMARCLNLKPDLILALAQAPLTPEILDRMKRFGMLTAFWFVEDFRELPYWREVAAGYGHFFAIQRREAFEESGGLDGVDFHYLPLACDPRVHRPVILNDRERKRYGSEVSFVGAGYYNRRVFFEGLLDLDFKIWGTEWDLLSPLSRAVQEGGRRVTAREAVKIFNGSAINVNLHSSTYHS